MSRPRRLRLFWQISLYGVALLLATVGAMAGMTSLLGMSGGPLEEQELTLRKAVDPPGPPPTPAALRATLEKYPRWYASVWGAQGELLANTSPSPLPLPPPGALGTDAGAESFFDAPPRRIITLHEGRHLALAIKMADGERIRLLLLLLSVIAAVVLLLALPVARWIASPLERLTRAARALGSGALDTRARLKARGEVGELAQAFDEMADRLQAVVRAERSLVANVSHELRTPIARMKVSLELAQAKGPSRAMQSMDELSVDLGELERLVEDLLSVARLDLSAQSPSGGLPALRRTPTAPAEILHDCAERFTRRFPARPLRLELGDGVAGATLNADAALLSRAFDNLLDNARKYSEAEIALRAELSAGALEVKVLDRGEGMSPDALAQAFTPFFRADPSRARESGGVGLGLALTRRIVEAHQGTLQLESTEGQGTCATVRLPLEPPDDTAEG